MKQFIQGADLSMLQHLEDHGVTYRQDGQVQDLLQIFREQWNGPDWSPHWEGRALFDSSGQMLPAMQVFQKQAAQR